MSGFDTIALNQISHITNGEENKRPFFPTQLYKRGRGKQFDGYLIEFSQAK
uniref:Uncharacterized protein n=1 Tax=Anguilla anguilla TaxID=7936 RepID=A0A0E9VQ60_ANGAN